MRLRALLTALLLAATPAAPHHTEPLGIALEGYHYPYDVEFLPVQVGPHAARLAYMDVAPTGPANGRTVLLFHGRNFPVSYWEPAIEALAQAGYRVVAPDQ